MGRRPPRRGDFRFAAAGCLLERDLVWRENDCYRRASYDPLAGGFGPVSTCRSTNMDYPLVREAIRRDRKLQNFLKWSILPQAEVVRERCTAVIAVGDARYGEGRRSRLARESVVETNDPGCPPNLDKR